MKNGFTLIELSIVLVIIGLLIGGILVAQSLIESAKINSLVRNLQQYEIGISSFKTKYKDKPGDSPHFTPPGNDDGNINFPAACNGIYSAAENRQVFAHLSQSKSISEVFSQYELTGCGGTTPTDFSMTHPVFYESSILAESWWGDGIANLLYSEVDSKNYFSSGLPYFTYKAVDKKIDDGMSYTGIMIGNADGDDCDEYGATSDNACQLYWFPDGTIFEGYRGDL